MSRIGRNVTDAVDGILTGKHYLIHDRDLLFTAEFQSMIANVSMGAVKLPPQSPNLNAHAERFVRSIKESYLDRTILIRGKNRSAQRPGISLRITLNETTQVCTTDSSIRIWAILKEQHRSLGESEWWPAELRPRAAA